jgi:ferrous iron transport protein B
MTEQQPEKHLHDAQNLTIGFIGNPNCGKTTLFNAFTGANLKVANWPGVTVEKVEGAIRRHNMNIHLVDLPGTYSLTSYTMEEIVSRDFILSDEVDVIINVVDASALERSLYLTLQLLELGKPVVMALNMMDIVEKRGMEIDLHRLPEMLGIPVIPVSARKRRGLDVLLHAAIHHRDAKHTDPLIHDHKAIGAHRLDHKMYAMVYSDPIEDRIDQLIAELEVKYPDIINPRWHAIKLLEQDQEVMKKHPVDRPDILDKNYETQIIREKYDFIEEIIHEVLLHKEESDKITDRLDKVLTDRVWGIPVFLLIMAVVFFLTFTVGDVLKGYMEDFIGWFGDGLEGLLTAWAVSDGLKSLIIDGVLGGVGTIITFLPNILILFLTLGFLEDSGYMARVAYVMEDIMSCLGLSGKAFIPLLLGFGCTVPAVMASRALEHKRDRFKVMLITPFMSCNARLTIYILFSEMFFGSHAMVVAYSMYLIGLVVAILVALLLHGIEKAQNRQTEDYLLIELPEYKMPDLHTVGIYMWEKVKSYLEKAGTTIFVATILIWFLLNFGPSGYTTDAGESFGAILGHVLVPVFRPIGLGFWQICLALLAGISAKEVVVSSCAVLFGITNASSGAGMTEFTAALEAIGFTSLNALCLMVFCLLYVPCAAALATIHKESGSWKWTFFEAFFQLATAWVFTFAAYHLLSSL